MRDAIESSVRKTGITYVELSRRSGVNVGTIRNMINYQTRGRLLVWQKLLDATGVELGWRPKENL